MLDSHLKNEHAFDNKIKSVGNGHDHPAKNSYNSSSFTLSPLGARVPSFIISRFSAIKRSRSEPRHGMAAVTMKSRIEQTDGGLK